MTALVTALVLMMGFAPGRVPARYVARAEAAAPLIEAAIDAEGGDPYLLGAVVAKESGFIPTARGAAAEIGYGQIHPRGMARIACADLAWATVPLDNLRCAERLLNAARNRCGGPPVRWLALFNGGHGRCGGDPHGYAKRVLAILAKARPELRTAMTP